MCRILSRRPVFLRWSLAVGEDKRIRLTALRLRWKRAMRPISEREARPGRASCRMNARSRENRVEVEAQLIDTLRSRLSPILDLLGHTAIQRPELRRLAKCWGA